jgi:hypothetical protein
MPTTTGTADPDDVRSRVIWAGTIAAPPAAAWGAGPVAVGSVAVVDWFAVVGRTGVVVTPVRVWAVLAGVVGLRVLVVDVLRLLVLVVDAVGLLVLVVEAVGLLVLVVEAVGLLVLVVEVVCVVEALRVGEALRVVATAFAARSALGLRVGTPEPRVPATLVAPKVHSSTSPGAGTSPNGPRGL